MIQFIYHSAYLGGNNMEHRQPVSVYMKLVTNVFDTVAKIPNAEIFVVSVLPRPKIEHYDWYVMH